MAQVIRGGLPVSGGTLPKYDCHWGALFTRFTPPRQLFVKKHYTKFHENPTAGLVVDTKPHIHTDRRTDVSHIRSIFKLRKEGLITSKDIRFSTGIKLLSLLI